VEVAAGTERVLLEVGRRRAHRALESDEVTEDASARSRSAVLQFTW
jgi:hypothetical protein